MGSGLPQNCKGFYCFHIGKQINQDQKISAFLENRIDNCNLYKYNKCV